MYESAMIAERIKFYTKENGMSLKDLFEQCGLGRNTIANLTSGRSIAHDSLAKIADVLNCSVDYLLGRTDVPSAESKPYLNTDLTMLQSNILTTVRGMGKESQEDLYKYARYLESSNVSTVTKQKEILQRLTEEPFTHEHRALLVGFVSAGGIINGIDDAKTIQSPLPCDFALYVEDDSMEPRIKKNTLVYIRESEILERNGQILAIQEDGYYIPRIYFKRVYREDNIFRLVTINGAYEDKLIHVKVAKIIGKLVYPSL